MTYNTTTTPPPSVGPVFVGFGKIQMKATLPLPISPPVERSILRYPQKQDFLIIFYRRRILCKHLLEQKN